MKNLILNLSQNLNLKISSELNSILNLKISSRVLMQMSLILSTLVFAKSLLAQDLVIENSTLNSSIQLDPNVKADFNRDGVNDRINCNGGSALIEIKDGKNNNLIFKWQIADRSIKHGSYNGDTLLFFTNCEVAEIIPGHPSIVISASYSNPAVGMRIIADQYVMFNNGSSIKATTIPVVGSSFKTYKAAGRSVACTAFPQKLVDQGYIRGALCFFAGYDGSIRLPADYGTMTALLKLQTNSSGQLEAIDLSATSGIMWAGGTNGTLMTKFPVVNGKYDGLHVMDGAFLDYDSDGLKDLFVVAQHGSIRVAKFEVDRNRREGLRATMDKIHQAGSGQMTEFLRIHPFDERNSSIKDKCLLISGEHPNVYDHLRCYEDREWIVYNLPRKVSHMVNNTVAINRLSDGYIYLSVPDGITSNRYYYKVRKTPGGIDGYIDGAKTVTSGVEIRGWACQVNLNEAIDIHTYLGGPSGTGKMVNSTLSNKSSEQAVRDRCGGRFNYRFSYIISTSTARQYKGKKIYIHGIRRIKNGPNDLINRSGHFIIPNNI